MIGDGMGPDEVAAIKGRLDAAVTAFLADDHASFDGIIVEDPLGIAVAAVLMLAGMFAELAEPGQTGVEAWAQFLEWERASAPPL